MFTKNGHAAYATPASIAWPRVAPVARASAYAAGAASSCHAAVTTFTATRTSSRAAASAAAGR